MANQTPKRLGRYELLARIASGGMGEIFLGRLEGAAGFEKLFVLKRVLPHLADDERFRTMLIDEAHIASKMSHPNICSVYELGDEAGQLFIVMEYLEGVTLLPVLRRAAKAKHVLAVGMVAGILQQACDALHYAHELTARDGASLGVVHRDVTPSNLFLTETGVAKVLDFGIAKVRNASANTQTGTVKGKYAYMAPEQLRSETLDRRVDVFALGVVAFEMLALRRLFQRKTDYLTFRAVMELPIPNVRDFRPDVPPRLAAAINRSLERDAAGRFATARELGTEIAEAVAGHAKVWTSGEIGDFVRQNFGEELRRRGSALSSAISLGARSVPVLSPTASDESTSDDDFPSIDGNIHRLAAIAPDTHTPTSPNLPPRIVGDGSRASVTPLTELAPPPGRTHAATSRVAAITNRGWGWKVFAIGIVGVICVGAFVIYRLWQQVQEQSQPPLINVEGTAAMETDAVQSSGADAAITVISSVDAPAATPDAAVHSTPTRRPRTEAEIAKFVRDRVTGRFGELQNCVRAHAGDLQKRELTLRVSVGSKPARCSIAPAEVDASALGGCLRRVCEGVNFGRFDADLTIKLPLQTAIR